ncbi:unnamed protein product [Protopolystoma xenopodis]|uniref:Uncharacterized protein n=1 Tax=Protopolystoma xenopodis TaxID=117903 RepID=A0A3S5CSC9_9PLAT|nr:unnamed protein product [Protopolystoma xenopodis]
MRIGMSEILNAFGDHELSRIELRHIQDGQTPITRGIWCVLPLPTGSQLTECLSSALEIVFVCHRGQMVFQSDPAA